MSRRAGVAIAVSLALCVPGVGAFRQLTYADALEAYRAGRFDQAIDAVKRIPWRDVDAVLDGVEDGPIDVLQAAVMLHTDAYFSFNGVALLTTGATGHVSRAERLARRIRPPDRSKFLPLWYQLRISHAHCEENHEPALVQEARRLFPSNAEVLLGSGSMHEARSLLGWGPTQIRLFNRRRLDTTHKRYDTREELEAAARDYKEALALEPANDEARLRLGRVLHQLNDVNGAAAVLEPLLARELPTAYAYLARLFLGAVEGDRGHGQRAADIYVAALETWPPSQSGFIGLSALLYADGQPTRSAEILTRMFDEEKVLEPYWAYIRGQCWHLQPRRTAARAMVAATP